MPGMLPAAFFDLDGTLLSVNSGRLWLNSERRAGRLSWWQALQGGFYLLAYRFSVLDMDAVMVKALRTVIGEQEQIIRNRTFAWFENEVKQHLKEGNWLTGDGKCQ